MTLQEGCVLWDAACWKEWQFAHFLHGIPVFSVLVFVSAALRSVFFFHFEEQ